MDDRNHYLLNGGDLASLKAWHQSYVAADDVRTSLESEVIQAVTVDRLNHVRIEENVQRLTSAADVADGFCAKCRHLFNHWPELTDRKSWDYAVGRAFHTHEIEAATRAGCKLCTFLLTRLRADKLLDVFRKIEARLHILGDGGTTSLSIENWGSLDNKSQLLWLNWPGKTTDHCNNDGALVGFESHFLKPERECFFFFCHDYHFADG